MFLAPATHFLAPANSEQYINNNKEKGKEKRKRKE